jgi:type I restriction enzyme S subunit
MQNGKHAIARNLLDGIGFGSTEFHVIRTSALILPEWIHFFIRQPYFLREATSYFVGAVGQQRVPESFLANYGISLPPLPEQKRIVAKVEGLMAEVEHARTACEARLEAARALPQAYLCQVFETEEAKKWERRRLGEVCEEVYRYPTYYSIEYVERGIPEIRGELIKKDGTLETDLTKYRFISKETSEGYSRTVLREGDFVLSVRGSMGKVAVVPNELDGANMTANLIRISPNRTFVYSPFLKLIFLSNYFQNALEELSPQTTIRTIKAPMLRSISIALPPLTEQKRIAIELQAKMEEAEKLKTSIEKELEAIKALPQAILRKAFRGEL